MDDFNLITLLFHNTVHSFPPVTADTINSFCTIATRRWGWVHWATRLLKEEMVIRDERGRKRQWTQVWSYGRWLTGRRMSGDGQLHPRGARCRQRRHCRRRLRNFGFVWNKYKTQFIPRLQLSESAVDSLLNFVSDIYNSLNLSIVLFLY